MIFHPIYGGGGSASLTAKAYASESELPTTAKDGDIAVISSTAAGDVYVQSAEPTEPKSGDLWIIFGVNGNHPSIAGNVTIYPRNAYQYANGSWEKVTMMVWSNGKWNSLLAYLLNGSDKCDDVTGDWGTFTQYASTVSPTSTGFNINGSNSGHQMAGIQTKKSIDISGYSKITFKGNISVFAEYNSPSFGIQKSKASQVDEIYVCDAWVYATKAGDYTITLDISGYTGEYYVGIVGGSVLTVTEIYME